MSANAGEIILDLVVNQNPFNRQVGSIQKLAAKAGKAIASAFAVKQLFDFGKACIELGSDLQEVQNVVDVTFPSMSAQINKFAQDAAASFGLSETMAKRYAGTFGAMSKAFGFSEAAAYEMSTTLTGLAGDVASFYNISQDESYTKLKSVFTGETESLKDLGVVMTQTALDAFAMANGYGKTTSAMSEAEKVALRYAFVQEKLSASSGDFMRTSDSWANQIKVLKLQMESFMSSVGQGLINVFTPVIKTLNTLMAKLVQVGDAFKSFTEKITGKKSTDLPSGMSSAADSSGEMEENVSAAGSAAKKLAKTLLGVDGLNLLSDNSNSSAGSSSSSGSYLWDSSAGYEADSDEGDVIEIPAKWQAVIDRLVELKNKAMEVFGDFKNGDFFEAGSDLSDLISGIFDLFSDAIGSVDWKGIGKNIGIFLAGLNWVDIFMSIVRFRLEIANAFIEVVSGAFEEAPIETTIIGLFVALKFTGLGAALGKAIGKAITGSSLARGVTAAFASFGGLSGLMTMNIATIIGAGTFGEIAVALCTGLFSAIVTYFVGFNFGKEIGKLIWPDSKELRDGFKLNLESAFKMFDGAAFFFKQVGEAFKKKDWAGIGWNLLMGILGGIGGALMLIPAAIGDLFKFLWESICGVFGIHSPAETMFPIGENILKGIIEGFKSVIKIFTETITEWFEKSVKPWFSKEKWKGIVNNVLDVFGKFGSDLKEKWVEIWTSLKTTASDIFEGIWGSIKNVINSILGGIEGMANGIVQGINKVISVLNGLKIDTPDWVTKLYGVGDFGFDIPYMNEMQIPRLAQGGYVKPNTPQLAMIGDNRHQGEVVAPEDKLYEITLRAMQDAIKQMAALMSGSTQAQADTGDIVIPVYLFPNSSKLDEFVVTAQDRRRFRSGGRS